MKSLIKQFPSIQTSSQLFSKSNKNSTQSSKKLNTQETLSQILCQFYAISNTCTKREKYWSSRNYLDTKLTLTSLILKTSMTGRNIWRWYRKVWRGINIRIDFFFATKYKPTLLVTMNPKFYMILLIVFIIICISKLIFIISVSKSHN